MALKLNILVLRSYLKRIYEYESHILGNKKVSAVKDHSENYMKLRLPLIRHLSRNRQLRSLRLEKCDTAKTMKPLYSGHHRDLEKVSAVRRCPLYRCLTFFSKEMTFRSLSG